MNKLEALVYRKYVTAVLQHLFSHILGYTEGFLVYGGRYTIIK